MRHLIERLAKAEDNFHKTRFLAPRLRGGQVRVRVQGLISTYRPIPEDFEGWGVFQASVKVLISGTHTMTIYNPNGRQKLETEINVQKVTLEQLGQPANLKVMREIAERTGGQAGGPADLNKLISAISLVAENEEIQERFRLWSNAWWGGAIVFLLAVYWVSRKVLGLI